jgi:glutathione S-transferase
MTPRLITIPMSHYCEKARWALDLAGVAYHEEVHAPLLSRLPTLRAGAPGTVPVLVTDEGIFGDSTEILRWVDRQVPLFEGDAAELEDSFDGELAYAARNLALFHVSPDRRLSKRLAFAGVPGWERAVGSAAFGGALWYLRRIYGVTRYTPITALEELRRIFGEVGARLAGGRRYLCGERLGAADIAFAALAAPVLLPDSPRPGLPHIDEVPPAMRAVAEELRATPAGAFALRLYDEERE